MLTEFIMSRLGWRDVWFSGSPGLKLDRRWHVGLWTGPQRDLICAKHCTTNEEADEKYLSPGANSILGACLRTLLKLAQQDGWGAVRKHFSMSAGERLVGLFEFENVAKGEWEKAEAYLSENLGDEALIALMHPCKWGQLSYNDAVKVVEGIKRNAQARKDKKDVGKEEA